MCIHRHAYSCIYNYLLGGLAIAIAVIGPAPAEKTSLLAFELVLVNNTGDRLC